MTGGFDPLALRQSWPMPRAPRPVVLIGAGSIVADAHLPAYRKAGYKVAGIFDLDTARAEALAQRWDIPAIFHSLAEVAAVPACVFDVATPPAAHCEVLQKLPEAATVLIQKPMGRTLDEAGAILQLCRAKRFTAAVNFQLRFSAMMLALRDAVCSDLLGEVVDVEVHLNLFTPWGLFAFLRGVERVEIAVHSIHYLDLIRSLLGNPVGVHAHTLGHPGSDMAQTRTTAILRFGGDVRCCLSINHNHDFGRRFQDASIRIEGTHGAAVAKLGLLLDYPTGEPDELWITDTRGKDGWRPVSLKGSWFPDAFIGRMSNLQRFASGEDTELHASVADAWHTMALVEACFESSAALPTAVATAP